MAHRSITTFRGRLLAVVALLALAATYLTPLVNADWNAWRYDHGHASLGTVAVHAHPWQEDTHALGDAATQDDAERPGVVFTGSDDSIPGMTAIWRLAPVEIRVILSAFEIEEPMPDPSAHQLSPPAPPPPRTALSHA